MNISGLIGKQVLDKNGNNVGKVADVDFNFPQWSVNHLIVWTGIFKKTPIGIDKIEKIGDKIILKTGKGELSKAELAIQSYKLGKLQASSQPNVDGHFGMGRSNNMGRVCVATSVGG